MPGAAARPSHRAIGGTTKLPTTSTPMRNPNANPVIMATPLTVGITGERGSSMLLTTVSMIKPRMSSITAAPSTT